LFLGDNDVVHEVEKLDSAPPVFVCDLHLPVATSKAANSVEVRL